MICIHNIIAVCATVGLVSLEGLITKRNIIPMAIYGPIAGIVGLHFVYVLICLEYFSTMRHKNIF